VRERFCVRLRENVVPLTVRHCTCTGTGAITSLRDYRRARRDINRARSRYPPTRKSTAATGVTMRSCGPLAIFAVPRDVHPSAKLQPRCAARLHNHLSENARCTDSAAIRRRDCSAERCVVANLSCWGMCRVRCIPGNDRFCCTCFVRRRSSG